MRITSNIGDPDCIHIAVCNVYLNDEFQDVVVEADDEKGFIVRLVKDGEGRLVIDAETGECQEERLEGAVWIEWLDEQSVDHWKSMNTFEPIENTSANTGEPE